MRVLGTCILTIILTAGAARASSFVVMGETAPASTPSIVTLGSPAPARLAATPASSWIDQSIHQLQQAYLSMKRAERQVYPSVEPLNAGAEETPSIVALGEPAPEIAYEKVAAIPPKQKHGPMFKPLVIRGGIVGDAFAPANAGSSTVATSTSPQAAPGDKAPAAPPPPAPAVPPPALAPKGLPQ